MLLNLDPNPAVKPPKYASVIDQLDRQAARIATNRVVAGVHFPVDSMAGRMLGVALGEYFVGRCTSGATTPRNIISRTFNAGVIDNAATATEFNPFAADQDLDAAPGAGKVYARVEGAPIPPSPLLAQVWGAAKAEWAGRFL